MGAWPTPPLNGSDGHRPPPPKPTRAAPSADAAAELLGEVGCTRLMVEAIADEFTDPTMDRVVRAFTAKIQHDEELARAVHERSTGPDLHAFRERLGSAREAGEISADIDLDLAVEMFNGPFHHRWLLRTGPIDHAYTDALVDTVLRALRP